MNDHHQAGNLDKRAAERLLDGAHDHAGLQALLAAAAAPGSAEELAGEDTAVAAFRAAPRPAPMSRTAALRRFLTIKVVAVVGGSLILTGGAAYATITGQLPGQDPGPSPSPSISDHKGTRGNEAPASQSSSPAPPYTSGSSTSSPSPSPSKSAKHGKSGAPGQQKKKHKGKRPRPPQHTPPRGPGNNNGTPPPGGGNEAGNTTTGGGTMGGSPGGSTGGGTGGNAPPTTGSINGSGQRN